MDAVNESSGARQSTPRVIKRYSNRKLYDTRDSRYVTLQQIGEMVRAGQEVQIIDNATKEDKTEVTLSLIISGDLKAQPRSVPLGALRELIQERSERLLSQLRGGPIGRLIPGAGSGPEGAPSAPAEAVQQTAGEGGQGVNKGRLTGIVESSRHTIDQWQAEIDERVRAIVPGLGHFRDLTAEVKRLSERVEQLERRLDGRSVEPQRSKKE
jgi:polyhydroxyalkanoate synthesis repressor PhaR